MVLAEDKQSDEPIINWILCRRPFPFVQAHGGWSLEGVNSCPPLYSEHVVSCLQFPDASSQPDSRRKRWVSIRYSILSRPGGIVQKNKRAEDNHSSLLALIFHRSSYAQGGRKKKCEGRRESLAVFFPDALCMRSDLQGDRSRFCCRGSARRRTRNHSPRVRGFSECAFI